MDNQVDAKTGTVRVTAVLPNEKGVLLPGQFVRVRVPVGEPRKEILMPPKTAVWSQLGSGPRCWVVNDKNVVVERDLEFGPLQDDGWRVVTKGLKAGDRVIVGLPEKDLTGTTVKPVEVAPEKEKK
jgi:membrane fusion protein (multidrug efflux system)